MDLGFLGEVLDELIMLMDKEADEEGTILSPKDVEITVLGQVALLSNNLANQQLELDNTMDLDAEVKATMLIRQGIKQCLEEEGLYLDPLAKDIWMPKETKYEKVYDGDYVTIYRADAVSVLLSKAIMAKEKNRLLIKEAIEKFPELEGLIVEYNGDPDYFKE